MRARAREFRPVPALSRALLTALALLIACAVPALAQKAPTSIAGVRLGTDIATIQAQLEPGLTETELDTRYITTYALKPTAGLRSCYVSAGNCEAPGRIVRVKANYEDDSRELFEGLLALLKKRYGEPRQWRGNAFGSLRVWKWSLHDPELGPVSIVLQHYNGDDDAFTKGNSLRIAATGLMAREKQCLRAKQPPRPAQPPMRLDPESLLPQ